MATGIFLVITGMLLANFRRSSQLAVVRNTAAAFAADVQRAQATALAGDRTAPDALAFGVHVDANAADRYVRFADRPRSAEAANGTYDDGEELADGVILLPREVRIRAVDPGPVADLLFAIPRATPRFSGSGATVRVEFARAGGDGVRTVIVNRISGQVSVE